MCRQWFKGADTTIMAKFLQWKYERLLADTDSEIVEKVHSALKAANDFLRLLFNSNLWMESARAREASAHGFTFLKSYASAATMCFNLLLPRFKLQPKLHMFAHVAHRLASDARLIGREGVVLNPLIYAVQLDEDFVGQIASIVRKQHARSVNRRVLQKYKLNLAMKW